jgi:methyl-accepting chemotaxis protein
MLALRKLTFMRRLLLATQIIGLAAGAVFPVIAAPMLGPAVYAWPFMLSCVVMGLSVGAVLYLLVRATLRRQLRQQLEALRPIVGHGQTADSSVEGLESAVNGTVAEIRALIGNTIATIDTFVPHYRILAESSRYLSDRTTEGKEAASAARRNIEAMSEKQRQISSQVELLTHRTQDEAALSRELSAALEEMSLAMEQSNARFLETTSTVDEMASSIREVGDQSERISRTVEATARDLDTIGESLNKIRRDTAAGADKVREVRVDAENGLQVVETSFGELERIAGESQKAMAAMARLELQTEEVGKIVGVIRELVSDTELLAFNAAIIAAQAGAEGRGFSVVAEEIKDLADRTTTSAKDIQRIIQAIARDTGEVTKAVAATGERIAEGKRQSQSAGAALRKIVTSADEASAASGEVAKLTVEQGERARALLEGAAQSINSVKAIAKAIQEQQIAAGRIQQGVAAMKGASDQIARGMDEQLRAKRDLDRGLEERNTQFAGVSEALHFQLAVTQEVFAHFNASENRLRGNAERAETINREIVELESLATRLREVSEQFSGLRNDKS